MDRVETLLQNLQQQFKDGATVGQLLVTTQMLQHELAHLQRNEPLTSKEAIVVSMPKQIIPAFKPAVETPITVEPEKTVELLQIDEAEVEAELDEIKRNAVAMQQMNTHSKPHLLFDLADEDIPTLAQQTPVLPLEINHVVAAEAPSVNDILNSPVAEVSHRLTDVPVKDLKKAIGINDRYLYINELFRGDEVMYERSIKTINSFAIWPEAEYWIRRELKTKLGWVDAEATVRQFDQLVKRRFS
jgi:hypothetical protein